MRVVIGDHTQSIVPPITRGPRSPSCLAGRQRLRDLRRWPEISRLHDVAATSSWHRWWLHDDCVGGRRSDLGGPYFRLLTPDLRLRTPHPIGDALVGGSCRLHRGDQLVDRAAPDQIRHDIRVRLEHQLADLVEVGGWLLAAGYWRYWCRHFNRLHVDCLDYVLAFTHLRVLLY